MHRKDPLRAINVLEPLLDQNAKDVQVWALAGDAQLQAGDYTAASNYLQKAIEMGADNAVIRAQLGLSHVGAGDIDSGVDELERAIRLDPTQYQATQLVDELERKLPDTAFVYYFKGLVAKVRNDVPAARSYYEKALKLNPVYMAAASSLAKLL